MDGAGRSNSASTPPSSSASLSFSMSALEAARRVLRTDPVNDEALNQLLLAHHGRCPSSSSSSPSLSPAEHSEIARKLECVEAIASRMDYSTTTINVTTAIPYPTSSSTSSLLSRVSCCWSILCSHLLSLKRMLQQRQQQEEEDNQSGSSLSKECVQSFPLPEDVRFAFQNRYDWWMRSGQHFGCIRTGASTTNSDQKNWEQARQKCKRLIEEIFC